MNFAGLDFSEIFNHKYGGGMKRQILRKNILTHIFFFSLFLVVPTLAFVRPPGESFFDVTRVFVQDTIANCVLLCFFYLNYYLLLPKLFFARKYVLYILCTVMFLAITFTLPHFITRHLPFVRQVPPPFMDGPRPLDMPGDGPPPIATFVLDEFRRHLYLFFTAIFFSFLLKTREHLAALKEEKLQAELRSLKAQISPHFLFNTLNSIYMLSIKKDNRASEAIVHLSGLMRYAIKEANDDTIPLQKETEYIAHYIELQKARLGNTAQVKYACSGDAGNKRIAPLILITYIENAFKYGVNPDVEGCVVEISLAITAEGIELQTANRKVQYVGQEQSTGIGLSNTYERLKHLYPGKHTLQIENMADVYSVNLSIKLTT